MSLALGLSIILGALGVIFAACAGWFGPIFRAEEPPEDGAPLPNIPPEAMKEAIRALAAANRTSAANGGAARPPAPKRPSDAELEVQNARCRAVRDTSLAAAKRICALGVDSDDVESLNEALNALQGVVDENEHAGPLGVIATTALCNALLEADALNPLEALQKHNDADVARKSTMLFTHVIPRIWSF